MRWSKLKSLVEERLADNVRKRVSFQSARYGNCTCGRFFILIDGVEVANLCTRAYWNRFHEWVNLEHPEIVNKYKESPVEYGEFSRQQAYEALFEYVHDISFEDALNSENPLHQMLAVLDARLGKRRLSKMNPEDYHPLVGMMLSLRLGFPNSPTTQCLS